MYAASPGIETWVPISICSNGNHYTTSPSFYFSIRHDRYTFFCVHKQFLPFLKFD